MTRKMNIPFSPPDITVEEANEVRDALLSGWITTGPRVKEFERRIAAYCSQTEYKTEGLPNVVCLSSATAAMEMAYRLIGIKEDDEVIVPAYTYTATASSVLHAGGKLVMCDSQPGTFEMDYEQLAKLITPRTKVIAAVDIAGVICDYSKIYEIVNRPEIKAMFKAESEIQEQYGRIIVLADCAHSFGSKRAYPQPLPEGKGEKCWRMAGTWADFSAFSFHAVKNFTTAEGGALAWNEAYPQPLPEGKGVHTADPMWYDMLEKFAKENRKNPTEAESVLWGILKGNALGYKFRRQHIIEDFIVDFYCNEARLTIELDGGYHNVPEQMKADAERTARLKELGYREIRFTNEEILCDIDNVIERIKQNCSTPFPSGEGWGEALYKKLQLLSLHGQSKDAFAKTQLGAWEYDVVGAYYKANMTDIMGAIGLVQMRRYPEMLARREHLIKYYNERLADLIKEGRVWVLNHFSNTYHSNGHLYQVRLLGKDEQYRNSVITKMAEMGIATNVHFKPLPMMTAYKELGFDIKDYPNAYDYYKNEITLPLWSKMTDEQAEYVMDCFISITKR